MATLLFIQSAFAKEANCTHSTNTGKNHITVFVNGIFNSQPEACASLGALRRLVDVDAEQSDFRLFYNPNNGLLADPAELIAQAGISNRAHDIARNDYTIRINGASARYNFVLGKIYVERLENGVYENEPEEEVLTRANRLYGYLKELVSEGRSVTLIAHSQGNYLIEAAIAIMRYRGEHDIAARIRVVGVAPVSSTTPNDVYVSLEGDLAIRLHRTRTSTLRYFTVLPANARGCVGRVLSNTCQETSRLSDIEWVTHGFSSVYLNPNILVDGISISTRIRDQIIRSRETLIDATTSTQVVTAAPLTPRQGQYRTISAARWMRETFGILLEAIGPSNTVSTYEWDFGDGRTQVSQAAGSRSASHNYNRDGTYVVSLTTRYRDGTVSVCRKTLVFDDNFRTDNRETLSATCE